VILVIKFEKKNYYLMALLLIIIYLFWHSPRLLLSRSRVFRAFVAVHSNRARIFKNTVIIFKKSKFKQLIQLRNLFRFSSFQRFKFSLRKRFFSLKKIGHLHYLSVFALLCHVIVWITLKIKNTIHFSSC